MNYMWMQRSEPSMYSTSIEYKFTKSSGTYSSVSQFNSKERNGYKAFMRIEYV